MPAKPWFYTSKTSLQDTLPNNIFDEHRHTFPIKYFRSEMYQFKKKSNSYQSLSFIVEMQGWVAFENQSVLSNYITQIRKIK